MDLAVRQARSWLQRFKQSEDKVARAAYALGLFELLSQNRDCAALADLIMGSQVLLIAATLNQTDLPWRQWRRDVRTRVEELGLMVQA